MFSNIHLSIFVHYSQFWIFPSIKLFTEQFYLEFLEVLILLLFYKDFFKFSRTFLDPRRFSFISFPNGVFHYCRTSIVFLTFICFLGNVEKFKRKERREIRLLEGTFIIFEFNLSRWNSLRSVVCGKRHTLEKTSWKIGDIWFSLLRTAAP